MALTKQDLKEIRHVVDDAIEEHPRFDRLYTEIIESVSEVIRDTHELVDERFNGIESRLGEVKREL
jgi:hypothetical protein